MRKVNQIIDFICRLVPLSFIVAVIVVVFRYVSTDDVDMIGVLGILVTLLIGWQIYNYLSLKAEMERRINEIINEKISLLNYLITGYTKARLSNALFAKGCSNTLDSLFDALEDLIKSKNIAQNDIFIDYAIQKIKGNIKDITSSNKGILKIKPNKKNYYIKILKNTVHEDKDDLLKILSDAVDTTQS